MITDALTAVSGSITGNTVTGQDFKGNGTTVVSTNTIDLGVARDIGEGAPLYARVEVTVAAAGGTSVEFQAISSAAADLSTPTVLGTSGAIAVASLTAGAKVAFRINPKLASNGQRYLGIQAVNVGNNTAISAYADFGLEIQDTKNYASGFAVL